MDNIWIISPSRNDDEKNFNEIWKHNTENNNISIGWSKLPENYADLPQSKQLELVKRHYPKISTPSKVAHVTRTFEYFYKSIGVGDFVVARFGKSKIVGIGIVTQKSIFNENSILAIKYNHPHICGINWFYTQEINYEEKNSYKALPIKTIVPRELSKFSEKVQNIITEYVADKQVYQLPSDEEKELSAFEGKIIEKWRMNRFIERSSKLVQDYKQKYIIGKKQQNCQGCEKDNAKQYGIEPINFLELHHINPLAGRKDIENSITKEQDVVLLCPNCHTAIHKMMLQRKEIKSMSLDEFKKRIKK
jgi:predicted HNH restriction endonuclease